MAIKILFFLIPALLSLDLTLSAQQPGQPSGTAVTPTVQVSFSDRLFASAREMKWSRLYFQSYDKTSEIAYLKLSAVHCLNAIQMMKETQASLSNTTRYYYVAKNEKISACRFYDRLLSASQRLAPEHHLNEIDRSMCE